MTERVLGPSGSRRRKTRLLTLTALMTAAFTVFFVVGAAADQSSGCDFAPNGTTYSCLGALSGSTFAGGDGNLLTSPTTYGTTDWQNVAGRNTGIDLPSGTGDNSFGQGSKTDDPNITVVSGSIPPNKSDLTRFYEASEVGSNSHNFLYLGWERTNNLGSANFNFEINQKTQPDLTTPGDKTLVRTAGDLLVTFDFTNGGGRPTVGLLRWLTSATVPVVTKPDNTTFSPNVCLAANSFPCWGDQLTLDGTDSIAAVNNLNAVTDPFVSATANNIGALRFGETAIDLTGAGVFPSGTCTAFGSAMVTGRSSSAFTAEIKDFIAPTPVNISNCGEIKIIKHTDPRGINQSFDYTSNIPAASTCTTDTTPAGFSLNDSGNTSSDNAANTEDCKAVPGGSYTVTEGTEPANFVLKSLSCTVDGSGGSSGSQHAAGSPQADITLAPGDTVTCTYTNQQQLGAIKITKTSSKAAATALPGAKFSIKSGGTAIAGSPFTTGSDGTVCVGSLPFGDYSVQETAAPSGYAIDDTTAHTVTVSKNSTCGDGNEATFSATDTPLTDIVAKATSEASGGTQSRVTCKDSANANVGNSPQPSASTFSDPAEVDANGLKPGTYTCTIIIDP
jgi:prealbumin domain-containing protein